MTKNNSQNRAIAENQHTSYLKRVIKDYGKYKDDPHPTFKSNQIRICDIYYKKNPKLRFMFDFGDGHEFDIEFKRNRETTNEKSKRNFPQIIDQRGIGPKQYPDY